MSKKLIYFSTNRLKRIAAFASLSACLFYSSSIAKAAPKAPSRPRNIWQEIADSLNIAQYTNNASVKKEINWYKEHPESLVKISQNAEPYIYYVTSEIKRRHMPLEIALLPMIESNYDPATTSTASASGLWQLMPSTARDLGVNINHWYDGRKDIVSSTHAALNYLQYLRERYGSWSLAFAAYNSGGGTVRKAIRYNKKHHKPTDYNSLPLPAETKRYVPKLLAIATILANPKTYHIAVKPVKNSPYFAEVPVETAINLDKVAELAGTDIAVINRLNPGFKHSTIVSNKSYKVLVPVSQENNFRANLTDYLEQHKDSNNVYTVQLGDSLSKIANDFHISTKFLKRSNHLSTTLIKVGQLIYIPV